MQISTFQALCLLPDDEHFARFTKYLHGRTGKIKLRRGHSWTLEQIVMLAESSTVARLVSHRGFGWLIALNQDYIKADGKKAKAFADECGIKFKRRKKS